MLRRKLFRDWSIRAKLRALFLAMTFIAALAVSLPMGLFDLWGMKRAMARDVTTLADVLARNSTAALSFRDREAARDVLQALRADPSITAACVYSDDGDAFATYARDGTPFTPPASEPENIRFSATRLIAFRPIFLGQERLGTIYVESDLQKLSAIYRQYRATFVAVLLATLALALVLARWFQQPISRPLAELVKVTRAVAGRADYSLRAQLPNRDEFGLLVRAFNEMLGDIQTRDVKLREYRDKLEDQVAARTIELSDANKQLKLQATALQTAANSIVITDVNGTIVWINPAFTAVSGYPAEELIGQNPRLLNSGLQQPNFWAEMWKQITSGKNWRGEVVNRRKDGTFYHEEMTVAPVSLEGDTITHFVCIKQDITERKLAEHALRAAEEKYRAIFEGAVVGIFQITVDGRPLSINRALAQIHGYDSPEQLLREVPNIANQLFVRAEQMQDLVCIALRDGEVRGAEVEAYHRDGTKKWLLATMRAVRDGKQTLLEGTVEDITDRKVAERQVKFLAYYDSLTHLPNRTLLNDRLTTAIAAASRHGEKIAVLFLDLDRFKIINDSLGHSFGDKLLRQVADRLRMWARQQDTIARVGGDEFLVVLNSLAHEQDAADAAERLIQTMTSEFRVDGLSLNVSCSIGISVFPDNGNDAETLIKNADAAMYCAKESGRNTYRFFTAEMNAQVVERLHVENSLRLALERQELFLMYQPQAEIVTGAMIGLEALIRWSHPELGLISPEKFIRIAENSGLILPIGEWVLRTACQQAKCWQDEGIAVPVAVNVSAVQFRQQRFPELIRNVIAETGVAPQLLQLELTESLLLSNADMVSRVLDELESMGVKLVIDDFGTGYSSLSYLRQFHVSKLKVDRSFVQDVATNSDDAAITTAIINMGKSLNLRVLAEGVEDYRQIAFLREHGCDEIQGYYVSRPARADEVAMLLRYGLPFAAEQAIRATEETAGPLEPYLPHTSELRRDQLLPPIRKQKQLVTAH